MGLPSEIAVLTKSIDIPLGPDEAFDLFTKGFGSWWPLPSHSVAGDDAVDCRFGSEKGGRIYEIDASGAEHDWGHIEHWDPPKRVVFTWHPGRGPATAQRVEVTFDGTGSGTRVVLEHSGWDVLGDEAAQHRHAYDEGWEYVLGRFASRAEGSDPKHLDRVD